MYFYSLTVFRSKFIDLNCLINSQYQFPHRTQVIGKRDAGAESKRSGRGGARGCAFVIRCLIQFPPNDFSFIFVLCRRSSPPIPIEMEKSDEYEDHTQLTDGVQQGERN